MPFNPHAYLFEVDSMLQHALIVRHAVGVAEFWFHFRTFVLLIWFIDFIVEYDCASMCAHCVNFFKSLICL